MEKKIKYIAIAFIVVVLAVAIGVAISVNKKEVYVDEDGIKHWLVKDKEGNTVLNEDGDIVVYALDEKGKRQKDKNGEYITGTIDFPQKLVKGNTFETPEYVLTMPEDWNLKSNGIFTLKKNNNVQVKVDIFELEEVTKIDSYIEDMLKNGDEFLNALKEKYPKLEQNVGECVITDKKLDCRTVEHKLAVEEGVTEYYVYSIYFVYGEKVYEISLTCFGSTYEVFAKDIDLVGIADANFVVKNTNKE